MYMYLAVQELTQLQDKHATRPDVFDDVEEEQEIEILTQEITQVRRSSVVSLMMVFTPPTCTCTFMYSSMPE